MYIIYLYINLRKSRDCLLHCLGVCVYVRARVRVRVSDHRFIQFALGSCYAVHIEALSIIMKVYTVRKNMQV